MVKKLLSVFICLTLIVPFGLMTANAAAGTIYESESNDTYSTADQTYDDYDNYGYLTSTNDVDWWKVVFNYAGSANFYLGNVPSGSDYDIRLYASNGTTLLASSLKGSNASELITYTVNMGTTYYIRINAAKGGSSTARYLFRTKVYPSKNIAAVPLYEQQQSDTCGSASGRMILASYGISVSEKNFRDKASVYGDGDYSYVYAIKDTLNYYLSQNGKSTRYKYTSVASYSTDGFSNLILRNVLNNHPCQALLKFSNSSYFPYNTSGHYVAVKGMRYESSGGYYSAIINDPIQSMYATRFVPISNMFSYTTAHYGGGYLIHVDS